MKRFITVLVIAAFVSSCGDTPSGKVKDFVPGVYVKTINDEFTRGMDTLAIEPLDENAGSYSIVKKMGYVQTIDGKQLSPQYKVENWTAIYDENTHQLMEQRKGKVISFLPDGDKLSLGSSEYQKIE